MLNTANDIEGTKKAMRYFEQAIAKDGSYAPAYAGLGDSYDVLCDLEALPPVEGLAGRRKAAQKALALDPTLPEAIATRGGVAVEDWDWPTAERCFKRAIELKPNDTTTHCWYGLVLAGLGRYDEAVTEAKRAKELDPLFQDDGLMGQILYWARHYDKALEHSRKILERHPSAPCAHGLIGPIYLLQGAKEPALAELARAAELSGHTSSAESYLGQAFAMCGRKIEAQQILQALITKSKDHYVGSLNIARIYAGLGDRDRAFEWLDKAYRKYESEWPLALADPMWDTLRSDPRFAALLKRIGLRS